MASITEQKLEHRQRVAGIAFCPRCGEQVELIEETEAWDADTGEHLEYGPAAGECCGLAFIDYWDGCFVIPLTTETHDDH